VRNFSALQNARVKTVCDLEPNRLDYIKTHYPEIETVTDIESVIDDKSIDAVAIATPVKTHYPIAKRFLEAGKHTFIEKPMAISAETCQDLIDIAEARSLALMVGHTFIYTSTIRKIKELIASGDIGEVMYISSRRLNLGLFQNDINVAWDLAPHDISIILFLLEQEPVSINCQGKAHLSPGIEDVTSMTLNFPNGSFAVIQSSWIDPRKVREMTIVGTKKMILFDDTEPLEKVKVFDKRVEVPPHYDTFAEFHYSYHYGDIYAPYIKQIEPLRVECQHFLDCIATGKKSESSGEEGLKVVRILEEATHSLKDGGGKVELAVT
jgi:predicted dehydrogenase